MKSLIRAIDRLGLQKDDVCMVSGIGCSSRLTGYVDFNTLHTTHGRPIAFATGVKLAKPSLSVIVVTGDGDALAIGGNHFIHAARRNMDLTILLFNNATYGMTGGATRPHHADRQGGQHGPAGEHRSAVRRLPTRHRRRRHLCRPRYLLSHATLDRLIEAGIKHKGFALVEILENCNTYYGRPNKIGLLDLLQWEKSNTVNTKAAERMTAEQLEGKILTGLLHESDRQEYVAQYETLITRARAKAGATA